MEGENEITVVVEDHSAEVVAAVETHAETEIALAEIHAEKEIAVATVQAEAAVEIAEAHAAVVDDTPPAWALALVAEVSALRAEVADVRAAAVVEEIIEEIEGEEIAEEIEEPEVIAIESGEVPASVPAAESLEPAIETPAQASTRKRHFVSL